MVDGLLTILTPTYNRAHTLHALYDTLVNQTYKQFIWLVVDDGSNDETYELIEEYKRQNKLNIVYLKKTNGGKHTALNFAIPQISSILTFIVDSDDCLTLDAVEQIVSIYEKYRHHEGLCGFSFLRVRPDGSPMIAKRLSQNEFIANFVQTRINGNLLGDMAEVWYTHCLAQYPFPEFPGERFIGEDIVWIRMAATYDMVFLSKEIYISEYLEGGLTKNRRRNNIKSPRGCLLRAEVHLDANLQFLHKLKAAMQYIIYGRFSGYNYSDLYRRSQHKMLYRFAFPPSFILYHFWRIAFM